MDNMIYKEEFQDRLYYAGNDQHGRQIAMEHEFSKHISKKIQHIILKRYQNHCQNSFMFINLVNQ